MICSLIVSRVLPTSAACHFAAAPLRWVNSIGMICCSANTSVTPKLWNFSIKSYMWHVLSYVGRFMVGIFDCSETIFSINIGIWGVHNGQEKTACSCIVGESGLVELGSPSKHLGKISLLAAGVAPCSQSPRHLTAKSKWPYFLSHG